MVLDVTKVPIRDAAGAVVGVQGILIDITARSTLEEQFRHAQRLQSIGRLAGGVAHDLNNLLTPILGYSDFLAAGFEPDDERADDVAQIRLAAERARDLTRQLLAFGRKQVLELAPLDLRDVVRDFRQLLRRTLREDIAIDLPPAEPCVVLADVGQIQQVLMNLAVNAQDAMPGGGTLTIAVSRTAADQVELLVADTGGGIDATILPHLFEPFFTTKRKGEGTGLGLATVPSAGCG